MILADKIVSMRKKAGWSQEELAAQLNVTRQSVSKWEGAQSMPDMDKVVQMSRLFGVTTDYLLKDEIEEPTPSEAADVSEGALRRVSMEEAARYIDMRRAAAPRMALAAFLCVVSPVTLMLLAARSEMAGARVTENMAVGIGLSALFILAAVGVAIFLSCASKVREFEFLNREPFETEYGVSGMVRERREQFRARYSRLTIIGTVLCILSAVPLFAAIGMNADDGTYVTAVCARRHACACARIRGSSAIASKRAASLSRISAATAFVNVTISIRSMSAPSHTSLNIRSTSTAVLPEPAAALTRISLPRASIARSCSSVHAIT